ncbi:MAG: SDR family oxidoreductase [Clostridiales bacterium]|nr:SDR family oxidoreductase [Clostridiales bacterium]
MTTKPRLDSLGEGVVTSPYRAGKQMNAERIALVTGSSRGIGREIVLRLAEDVDGVAVHYKKSRQAALEVVEKIRARRKRSHAFAADLTKAGQADRLIKRVEMKFGRLDILVNNFGPILVRPWEEFKTAEWEFLFRSNVVSALGCIKAALPGMRARRWGRIINIGYHRVEQLAAFSTITPYAAAKTGLLILTRSVAASEFKSGITVNMVSPGLIKGGLLPAGGKIPTEILGSKMDVAEAVAFLASEKAGHITGSNLVVAGTWKL